MTTKTNPPQSAAPKTRGQPTKYRDDIPEQVENLCKIYGSTDEQIAEFLKVNIDTIYEWKKVHPQFSEAIKKGKDAYDSKEVETSLLKRAKGYSRIVERVTKTGDVVECVEEVPPDPVSCFFWLKNRNPERWKDKQDIEHSGQIQVVPALVIKS